MNHQPFHDLLRVLTNTLNYKSEIVMCFFLMDFLTVWIFLGLTML